MALKSHRFNNRQTGTTLLTMPLIVMDKILSYLPYDEVASLREVCQQFNQIGQQTLTRGFQKVEKYHAQCLKRVKSQLPRRESERRNHPLARHSDVLTAVETRLSLLNMTFMKYVDNNLCCFIPGKVIDEVYDILRYIESTTAPPRAHEILQELRDISSMAMEYFDEKIVPTFRGNNMQYLRCGATIGYLPGQIKFKHGLEELEAAQKVVLTAIVRRENKSLLSKVNKLTRKVSELQKAMIDQNVKVNEISRRCLEYDQKLADVMEVVSGFAQPTTGEEPKTEQAKDFINPKASTSSGVKNNTSSSSATPQMQTRNAKRKAKASTSAATKRQRPI